MLSRYSVKKPYTVVVAVVLVLIWEMILHKNEHRFAAKYGYALCHGYDHLPGSKP